MKISIIDAFPLILALITVIGIKPVTPFSSISENYFSIQTGKCLRGIFAISVMFHHLAQVTKDGLLFNGFSHIGYLCVGMFFFASGFGLQKSYMKKSENYRKGFLIKRLPAIILPYAAIAAVYLIVMSIFSKPKSVQKLFSDVLEASNSWYIICILLFYIAFYILMLICKKNYKAMIIGALIWFAAYVAVCKLLNVGNWWYNATVLLVFGMFWALYETKILKIIQRFYYVLFIASVVMTVITTIGRYKADKIIPFPEIKVISTSLSAVFFVICILLLTAKFNFGNRVLSFLGEISLEIYLVHGIFILTLRGSYYSIESDPLFVFISVFGSVALASIVHYALKPLIAKFRNTPNRISY